MTRRSADCCPRERPSEAAPRAASPAVSPKRGRGRAPRPAAARMRGVPYRRRVVRHRQRVGTTVRPWGVPRQAPDLRPPARQSSSPAATRVGAAIRGGIGRRSSSGSKRQPCGDIDALVAQQPRVCRLTGSASDETEAGAACEDVSELGVAERSVRSCDCLSCCDCVPIPRLVRTGRRHCLGNRGVLVGEQPVFRPRPTRHKRQRGRPSAASAGAASNSANSAERRRSAGNSRRARSCALPA